MTFLRAAYLSTLVLAAAVSPATAQEVRYCPKFRVQYMGFYSGWIVDKVNCNSMSTPPCTCPGTEAVLWSQDLQATSGCSDTCPAPCFAAPGFKAADGTASACAAPVQAEPLPPGFRRSMRMKTRKRKSAKVTEFEFPRDANDHVTVWDDNARGINIGVYKDADTSEEPDWSIRVFPMNLQTTVGEQTIRLGFQIRDLDEGDLDAKVVLGSDFLPVEDPFADPTDKKVEGLYVLTFKEASEPAEAEKHQWWVRMSDLPLP